MTPHTSTEHARLFNADLRRWPEVLAPGSVVLSHIDGTYERRGDGGTIMIYTAPVNANEDAIREGLAAADNRARQWGWTLEDGD